MAVNLVFPRSHDLLPIKGIKLGITEAAIKKADRKDLLVITLESNTRISGVFTQNHFRAAPVVISQKNLSSGKPIRALVINTGNANAGTGERGLKDANRVCQEVARLINCDPNQVLPFSTGVIMEPLPVQRVMAGLPGCIAALTESAWLAAAQAIMTTDTVPKAFSKKVNISGDPVTITGIAKGAGMICPNMATMLGFIATDAALAQPLVNEVVRYAADRSFNCITVDGDTSTNDAFMLMATGEASHLEITQSDHADYFQLRDAIAEVAIKLAQAIVRDGEGATKFISVVVEHGASYDECKNVAYAIANSPLVKTAFFASDPNLGRILAAIGYSNISDLDMTKVILHLDDLLVVENGSRALNYSETRAQEVMAQSEITIKVQLGRGDFSATVWTCDLSHEYVKINAEYRT